jgi:ankyrin repeat protein
MVQLALQRGLDVNAADEYGQTPLMRAADRGRVDAIAVLLQAGARIDACDTDGNTALQLAVHCFSQNMSHRVAHAC